MKTRNLFLAVILFMWMLQTSDVNAQKHGMTKDATLTESAVNLKITMRALWQDHVSWTRNVVLCLVDGLPGSEQAVNRLLKNQEDIGNAVRKYYGDEAAKQLTALLKEHIQIAAEVVTAAKANNKAGLDAANARWYKNADEIGTFLSKANPNWNEAEMQAMMHDHLKLLTDETVSRIKKDYNADVSAYDKSQKQILEMADMLSDGIIEQFPEKFKT